MSGQTIGLYSLKLIVLRLGSFLLLERSHCLNYQALVSTINVLSVSLTLLFTQCQETPHSYDPHPTNLANHSNQPPATPYPWSDSHPSAGAVVGVDPPLPPSTPLRPPPSYLESQNY
mmetsp:Transcript_8945/g.20037  ORF Transcript_8945/g.20037 Transcript_8945/m.20037 type:complete len:117 (-) Transcript_8945:788-1138(-)